MKIIFPVLVAFSIAQTSTTTSTAAISTTVTSSASNGATDQDSSNVDITAFAASEGGDVGAPTTDDVTAITDGTSDSTSGSSEPSTIHRTYGPSSDDQALETVEPVQVKWEHLSQVEDGKILIYWSDRVRFFTQNLPFSGQLVRSIFRPH